MGEVGYCLNDAIQSREVSNYHRRDQFSDGVGASQGISWQQQLGHVRAVRARSHEEGARVSGGLHGQLYGAPDPRGQRYFHRSCAAEISASLHLRTQRD